MSEIEQHVMSREDAERLTERARIVATTLVEARDKLTTILREAQEGRVWEALNMPNIQAWTAFTFSETPLAQLSREDRRVLVKELADEGYSSRAIAPMVGASDRQIRRDLAGGTDVPPRPPVAPAEPTFDPTPEWDTVNTETGEVTEPTPQPRSITGMDGKTYTRPEPKEAIAPLSDREAPTGPKRRPLPDQFRDATVDLRKITERLEKLIADDRFPQNREQVALKHQSDLSRASTALAKVIDAFNIN